MAEQCSRMGLLLQADVDGELDIGTTADVTAHLAECPQCQALQTDMRRLSQRLRREIPRHAAPARLRAALEAASVAAKPAADAVIAHMPGVARKPVAGRWSGRLATLTRQMLPFGATAALAASLTIAIVMPRNGNVTDSVIAGHIRALQPGHLMDVVSTDQHTVKPWFDGRLDYAPPVHDLAGAGFPLTGGRLDYLSGRPVAALTYRRQQHVIDLFVWPDTRDSDAVPASGERNGYNFVRWTQGEMIFWAVSDLKDAELEQFVKLFRASS